MGIIQPMKFDAIIVGTGQAGPSLAGKNFSERFGPQLRDIVRTERGIRPNCSC